MCTQKIYKKSFSTVCYPYTEGVPRVQIVASSTRSLSETLQITFLLSFL
uniref:Uncharacterized protein n=1 Tax=Arundo donax TaxID=35708 RepID=A0A0A8ZCQ9_ARUDO